MSKPDDEAKLQEVKVVLARLQRMSSDPEEFFAQSGEPRPGATNAAPGRDAAHKAGGKSQRHSGAPRSRLVMVGYGLLALMLISGSALYVVQLTNSPWSENLQVAADKPAAPERGAEAPPPVPPASPPAPVAVAPAPPASAAPPLPTPSSPGPPAPIAEPNPAAAAVAEAMRLINAGQVQSGRALLRSMAAKQMTAEVAWSLARSYDPNLLNSIPSADAAPDVGEAERWYREWHTIALKEGLVSGTSSVDRILRSLR